MAEPFFFGGVPLVVDTPPWARRPGDRDSAETPEAMADAYHIPHADHPPLASAHCPLCNRLVALEALTAATWLPYEVAGWLAAQHDGWHRERGGCPACARKAMEEVLLMWAQSPAPHGDGVGLVAPQAWTCLPTRTRLGVDSELDGTGVTVAFIDAAFFPHPDLIYPHNRIRAWVNVAADRKKACLFRRDEEPRWPGWDDLYPSQWHGLMTSGVACGNGTLSHGLYRGLASNADVVLLQSIDARGRIPNHVIARGLQWVLRYGAKFNIKVVNISVGGDPVRTLEGNEVDTLAAQLVERGITVVAAIGNSGIRRVHPPVTCPQVISVGGIDDRDTLDPIAWRMWHSNYGQAIDGTPKPDIVAPSWRVVAPLLPGTSVGLEAADLFARRARGDVDAEMRINGQKLVSPHYQHMDGTSVAAPIVASLAACLLQARPDLTPADIRRVLQRSATRIADAPRGRQGAGAILGGVALGKVGGYTSEQDEEDFRGEGDE